MRSLERRWFWVKCEWTMSQRLGKKEECLMCQIWKGWDCMEEWGVGVRCLSCCMKFFVFVYIVRSHRSIVLKFIPDKRKSKTEKEKEKNVFCFTLFCALYFTILCHPLHSRSIFFRKLSFLVFCVLKRAFACNCRQLNFMSF